MRQQSATAHASVFASAILGGLFLLLCCCGCTTTAPRVTLQDCYDAGRLSAALYLMKQDDFSAKDNKRIRKAYTVFHASLELLAQERDIGKALLPMILAELDEDDQAAAVFLAAVVDSIVSRTQLVADQQVLQDPGSRFRVVLACLRAVDCGIIDTVSHLPAPPPKPEANQ
jgi:hypothetical protein